jgi:hypothetical protein
MKFTTVAKSVMLGLAILLASSAFAATKGSLQISHPVTLNGTQLKPGDYKVEWDGSGPNVEVSILQGKNLIAKTSAKVVEMSAAPASSAAVTRTNSDGSSSLSGARFGGKKIALEFGEASDSMAGSSK